MISKCNMHSRSGEKTMLLFSLTIKMYNWDGMQQKMRSKLNSKPFECLMLVLIVIGTHREEKRKSSGKWIFFFRTKIAFRKKSSLLSIHNAWILENSILKSSPTVDWIICCCWCADTGDTDIVALIYLFIDFIFVIVLSGLCGCSIGVVLNVINLCSMRPPRDFYCCRKNGLFRGIKREMNM